MKLKSIIPLILLAIIWGVYYVATHAAVEYMPVFVVGIVIRLITMVLLTVLMLSRGQLGSLFTTNGVRFKLILIGVLGFLLDFTAFVGLSLSPAGSGTALLKCDVLMVNIISVIIYKHKFSKMDWLYTFVMLFGVLMVMDINIFHFDLGNAGNIFFILSALFVSINAFVIKSVMKDKKNPQPDNVVAFYNNFITLILFTIFAIFSGEISKLALIKQNTLLAAALLIAGIGQTLIYIFYYYNLRRFPVWIVKVFLLMMPVFATIISFLAFGEKMGKVQYIGMMIVLLGAFGIIMQQKKRDLSDKA